jgi:hypothetical protein
VKGTKTDAPRGQVIAECEDCPRIDAETEIRLARGLDVPAAYPRPLSAGTTEPA